MEDGTDQNDTQQFENIIDLVLSTGSDTSTSQLIGQLVNWLVVKTWGFQTTWNTVYMAVRLRANVYYFNFVMIYLPFFYTFCRLFEGYRPKPTKPAATGIQLKATRVNIKALPVPPLLLNPLHEMQNISVSKGTFEIAIICGAGELIWALCS